MAFRDFCWTEPSKYQPCLQWDFLCSNINDEKSCASSKLKQNCLYTKHRPKILAHEEVFWK